MPDKDTKQNETTVPVGRTIIHTADGQIHITKSGNGTIKVTKGW